MYKVKKSKGYGGIVVVENTETRSSIMVGRPTASMQRLLEDAGYGLHSIVDEWDITIKEDIAKEIAAMAMKMRKPVRSQKPASQSEQPPAHQEDVASAPDVDIFDLIYG